MSPAGPRMASLRDSRIKGTTASLVLATVSSVAWISRPERMRNATRPIRISVCGRRKASPGVDIGDRRIRVGDRVIQMTNNYDLDVFNGDIGQVVSVHAGRGRNTARIRVAFDGREVEYSGAEAKELNHAYAITVHKSQGSEFPFVIFASTTQHYAMLKKTLAYTAVTRARKYCAIVGQERAMKISVRQTDAGRITGLARRLAIQSAELDRHEAPGG